MKRDDSTARKPTDVDDYVRWLRTEHGAHIESRHEQHFGLVALKVREEFRRSPFWQAVIGDLRDLDAEYRLRTRVSLLTSHAEPELLTKSYRSFLLKTYRKNILQNVNWPSAPPGGWLLPGNWLSRINDIVRCLLVVKYLDGVQFLLDAIRARCDLNDVQCRMDLEAREEGYYAAHVYVTEIYDVPRLTFDTEQTAVSIEIQVTTQLQEIIRGLLHSHYEARRQLVSPAEMQWQWNYGSEEFATNYLGHILHYVEGMVVGIRDRQKGRE